MKRHDFSSRANALRTAKGLLTLEQIDREVEKYWAEVEQDEAMQDIIDNQEARNGNRG